MKILGRERHEGVRLCEALGLDPAKVIRFEWFAMNPRKVRVVILDGPLPTDQHAEDHDIPEEWRS